MSISNYSASRLVYEVNGRVIRNWGQSETPVVDTTLNPVRTLSQGQLDDAIVIERKNSGTQHVLNILAGSPDAAFLWGIFKGDGRVQVAWNIVGTLDSFISLEGVIVDRGDTDQGSGTTKSDEQFTIQFNKVIELRGGV